MKPKMIAFIIFCIILDSFVTFTDLKPFTDDEGYFRKVYYRNSSNYFYIYCDFMENIDLHEGKVIEYKIDNSNGNLISQRIIVDECFFCFLGLLKDISNNEFILSMRTREGEEYYYFKDDINISKLSIQSESYAIEILEDKSLIIGTLEYKYSSDNVYFPILYFFSYPYGEYPNYTVEKNYLKMDFFSINYKIISLKDNILLICGSLTPGNYTMEIFDKKFTTIFIGNYNISCEINSIDIMHPKSKDKNFFFYCLGYITKCNYGEFKNNVISISSSYINFNRNFYLKGFYQFEKNKILGYFKESVYRNIIIAIFDFSNETFKYTSFKIPIQYSPFLQIIITYFPFKGYTLFSNSQNFEDYFYEGNLNTLCLYYNIEAKLKEIQKLLLKYYIYNIFDENEEQNFKIKFINIDKRLKLYKDKEEINTNDIYYNSRDNFNFIINEYGDLQDLLIEYQILSLKQVCSINVVISEINELDIDDKREKCIFNNETPFSEIIKTNLDTIFNMTQKYEIIIKFQLEQNNLDIFLNNISIKCEKKIDKNEFVCEIPHSLIKKYNPKKLNKYKIYSYLCCKNLILLGNLQIGDRLVLDIFNAKNFTKISKQLKDNYDASEIIEKFSINMINYYKRFASYSYCDDDYISEKKCCEKMHSIFSDWELVFHKEYSSTLQKKFEYFGFMLSEIPIQILEGFKIYIYNIAMFRSKKFKKIVITFPGTTNIIQLVEELLGCEMVVRGQFSTSKFFEYLLNIIKDDVKEAIHKYYKRDYQIIFTGHSLGGAMATLSVYEFLNYDFIESSVDENYKPILITFGQPRVGNEQFARFITEKAIIFRIAKINDLITIVPPIKPLKSHQLIENIEKDFYLEIILMNYISNFYINKNFPVLNLYINFLIEKYYSNKSKCSKYCHTGGLYVLSENSDLFIHCADFFNEETGHDICKNNEIMSLSQLSQLSFDDIGNAHDKYGDYIMDKCQYNKNLEFIIIRSNK